MSQDLMTVGDLIDNLQKFPRNLPIIYAKDDEGNSFQSVTYGPSIKYVCSPIKRYAEAWSSRKEIEEDEELEEKDKKNIIKVVCIN